MVGQRGASLKHGLGPLNLAERGSRLRNIWDIGPGMCQDAGKENFDGIVLTGLHGSHGSYLWFEKETCILCFLGDFQASGNKNRSTKNRQILTLSDLFTVDVDMD